MPGGHLHAHSHSHGHPPGVASFSSLPEEGGLRAWDHVFLPEGVRDGLLRRVVFTMRNRGRLAGMRSALQGMLLLAGPPGTGKSTTARTVANKAAEHLSGEGTSSLVKIDPHSLPSSSLGESQQNVTDLLGPVLSEYTERTDFVFVIIDEVESFAVKRSSASFETNPVDVHRATDAVLEGVDQLLFSHPNIVILMTTNFPEAVDDALVSRVDDVIPFELPNREQIAAILRDTLDEFARVWPPLQRFVDSESDLLTIAEWCEGMSGRDVRKVVTSAIMQRSETAADPGLLELKDFEQALVPTGSPGRV
jgi:pachytene checkpoint protein 2